MPQKRLAVLDDFRAIAIILVVAMHGFTTFFIVTINSNSILQLPILSGGTGVGLFFILSGFLVTRPFIAAELNNTAVSLKEYAIQRALRILPIYYLAVCLAIWATGNSSRTLDAILFNANGSDFAQYSAVWWSLVVEVHFYILAPLVYIANRAAKSNIPLILFLLIWLTLYSLYSLRLLPIGFPASQSLDISLFCQLHAFLVGFLLSIMHSRKMLLGCRKLALLSLPILIAMLTLALIPRMGAGTSFLFKYHFQAFYESLLWGAILYACIINGKSFLGVIGRYLARISYSLYLVHVPLFYALSIWHIEHASELPPVTIWLIANIVSLLASTALYFAVEKPFLDFKERMRQRQLASAPIMHEP